MRGIGKNKNHVVFKIFLLLSQPSKVFVLRTTLKLIIA